MVKVKLWYDLRTYDHHLLRSFQVAVKSIKLQDERVLCNVMTSTLVLTGCSMQELRRELETWKRLCHPNILPLLGIARGFGPSLSMVSRWLENGPLTSYLVKHKDITLFDRLRLVSFRMTKHEFY